MKGRALVIQQSLALCNCINFQHNQALTTASCCLHVRAREHVEANLIHRVFLNLWFAKPMVLQPAGLHENDGNHENDENGEDNSDSNKEEGWVLDQQKSRKPRKWRKPRESGVQTTEVCPNNGFRRARLKLLEAGIRMPLRMQGEGARVWDSWNSFGRH